MIGFETKIHLLNKKLTNFMTLKPIDEGLHERLIAILDYLGCDKNTSEVARSVGINSQNISNIYKRQTIPKLNLIAKIAHKYPDDVNYHWLLTGEGTMLPSHHPKAALYLDVNQVADESKPYRKDRIEEYNTYLLKLQEKDSKIIDLQAELAESQQKIISLLEKFLQN
jgi:DNA-binding phage protein